MFLHAMQTVIVNGHLPIDPQAAAVVGSEVKSIDAVGRNFQESFEYNTRILFPGKHPGGYIGYRTSACGRQPLQIPDRR